MTGEQKQSIQEMRRQGFSNAHIAETLGLSVNTVKSFCRRNNLKAEECSAACDASNETGNEESKTYEENKDSCKQCGKHLVHKEKHKPKTFCCDKCRFEWWNTHRNEVKRKSAHHLTCAYCGGIITSYDKNRKYCGHACYIADRFREGNRYDERAI